MTISPAVWGITVVGLLAVILIDLWIVDRRDAPFTPRQAVRWVVFYVALAMAFSGWLLYAHGSRIAGEFLAGYVTEYSLSVDNLFVFLIIMSSFAVPAAYQHRVLLWGIVIALVLRGILIYLGAAVIERFAFTFVIFGGFLIWTAFKVWSAGDEEVDPDDNPVVLFLERFVPTTRDYHGHKLTIRIDGKRHLTPMLMVIVAIGTTDLLFALDSIPAIFGLTQEAYIVFSANAFALMGLRQLYFLLHGLLDRLIYLSKGIAVVLGFIGFKLLLHACHEVWDLNVPEVGIATSLAVIVGVLAITTIWSLVAVRRDPSLLTESEERHAEQEAQQRAGEALKRLREERKAAEDDNRGQPEAG